MGAFCEGEKVYEVEDGLVESGRQMQRSPVHQSDLSKTKSSDSHPTRMPRVIVQEAEALKETCWPTSVHVFEGLLGLIRSLKLHISVAPGQMWVDPVHRQVDHFDFSISGKDLLDVVLCKKKDIQYACQNHGNRKLIIFEGMLLLLMYKII